MIVYNHGRKWFTKLADAQAWRRQIVRPAPVIKITVEGRDDLAALLNALCEPPAPDQPVPAPATPELVERAFVPVDRDIPDYVPRFLLDHDGKKIWDERHGFPGRKEKII